MASDDFSDLLKFLAVGLGAAAAGALIRALSDKPVNRYQAGVASQTPASKVADVLESAAQQHLVSVTGDPASPNEREYSLSA